MSKLKPCPFCGGKAVLRAERCAEDSEHAWVSCGSCGVATEPAEAPFAAQVKPIAVEMWNDREDAERDALRAEVEELMARIEKALEYVDSFETSQLNPARTILKSILRP